MDITITPPWKRLESHAERLRHTHLREFFSSDPARAEKFCLEGGGLRVDFSKQRIHREVLDDLMALARAANLESWRDAMFSGQSINNSEHRAVLHTALRHRGSVFPSADFNVMPAVRKELERMADMARRIRDGRWQGFSGQPIRHVVSIGIGGSDLGPKMATHALQALSHSTLSVHYVSNLDGAGLAPLLQRLDPRNTLFIVESKTFTTQETVTNARTARAWLHSNVASDQTGERHDEQLAEATARHFLAVTSAPQLAIDFGVAPVNVLEMWDWVGGRYSLWSAVGLPLMISVGPNAFFELLEGAAAMDDIFCKLPLEQNLPVWMGLIGLWNTNFLGAETLAVLPYSESLHHLPAFLQQLEMESNGKKVGRDGHPIACKTCPIVWGEIGINGQHAFFQLLHQGGRLVPCDFIATVQADFPLPGHQEALLANCFGQSAALAFGRTDSEARADMEQCGMPESEIESLLPHKIFPGNQPSTTILMSALNPHELGGLLALYEHKTFVQGVVWGINSFDQWGVELGKAIARQILPALTEPSAVAASLLDPSTRALIAHARNPSGR